MFYCFSKPRSQRWLTKVEDEHKPETKVPVPEGRSLHLRGDNCPAESCRGYRQNSPPGSLSQALYKEDIVLFKLSSEINPSELMFSAISLLLLWHRNPGSYNLVSFTHFFFLHFHFTIVTLKCKFPSSVSIPSFVFSIPGQNLYV